MESEDGPLIGICNRIYETATENGVKPRGLYPSLLRRVRDLLDAVDDPAEVELVCLLIAENDKTSFVAYRSLAWTSFEMFRDRAGVPPGTWRYALRLRELPEGKTRQSVDYWFGELKDAGDRGDGDQQTLAQDMMTRLLETYDALEDLTF